MTDTVRIKACTDFNRFHGDVGAGTDQVKICVCGSCGIMHIKGGNELTKFGFIPLSACKVLELNVQVLEELGNLPVDLQQAWNVHTDINGIAYHVYENLLQVNPGESHVTYSDLVKRFIGF